MRRPFAAALAVVLLTLVACSDDTTDDPPDVTATDRGAGDGDGGTARDAPGGGVDVALLDPGAEPRRLLRLSPPEGCEQPMTLRNVTEQHVSVGDERESTASGVEYDVTYRCESVTDEEIDVRMRFDAARLLDAPPATREQVQVLLEALVGAEGRTVFDHRGRILETDTPVPASVEDTGEGFARAMEQMLSSLEDGMAQAATALPEEPVGPGARWRVEGEMRLSGMATRLVTEYSLTELGEHAAHATTVTRMEFLPGPVDLPGLPAGAMQVVSGSFEGTGSASWDLRAPMASYAQVLDGEAALRVLRGDEIVEVVQEMHQETAARPRP